MTTARSLFTVHVAAPPIGWVQPCAACAQPLADNTAWAEGRARSGGWWPVGARIGTGKTTNGKGSMSYAVHPEDRPLADDERLCVGAN